MTLDEKSPLANSLQKLSIDNILTSEQPARVSGLIGPAQSLLQAVIAQKTIGPLVVVVADEERLSTATSDLKSFLNAINYPQDVLSFPPFALNPYCGLKPHLEVTSKRVNALTALLQQKQVIIITTATALLYRTSSPKRLKEHSFTLRSGSFLNTIEIERLLVKSGYCQQDPVTTPGDFTLRGGILDVFPPTEKFPIRLEFLGDELEDIRVFNPHTQRTSQVLKEVLIPPANEWAAINSNAHQNDTTTLDNNKSLDFRLVQHADFQSTFFDYLGNHLWKKCIVAEEPTQITRIIETEWEKILASYIDKNNNNSVTEPSKLLVDLDTITKILATNVIQLEELGVLGEETHHVSSSILPSFSGQTTRLIKEVQHHLSLGKQVHVFVSNKGIADRTVKLLAEVGLTAGHSNDQVARSGHVLLEQGKLSQSFVIPKISLVAININEVFEKQTRDSPRKSLRLRSFFSDFRDLSIGDYVVHAEHGIGVFLGLKQLSSADPNEFVVLQYAGSDKLYVPINNLENLEKYKTAESSKPKLDKLGATGWEKTKKRVSQSVHDMAKELLKFYAERKKASGYSFAKDSGWMREFEDLFEFEETKDQLEAITSVKEDMEAPSPMDRLLCGDVGYGKTEVAMRASFKAVTDGKQVAVLVPTTVLASQHFVTFRKRFEPFPIRVEMLSRFRTRSEQRKIVEDLATGGVDIVIGTHRLLSKDISFHSLGLLIVDEEQRFGVTHKERLKRMSLGVDCLTMTATPIPRTLHMSLSSLRDLSLIETPPKGRMAIQTHITPLNAKVLTEAIRYELGRQGQVYFVHNQIGSIHSLASYLKRLVPEARIVVGHGQMKATELEQVMLSFIRHEFDILVSTTIIENGLDIPRVNTLMVNRAERFGLSQLYQLRGRVGRTTRRAYAYLLVPGRSYLSPIAQRRLAAIREFSELGAGFRIAALDMELRGAGNLLGREQHGHIEAVGFDLYFRLLDQAIQQLSGVEVPRQRSQVHLNLQLQLRIPNTFISDTNQRISIYKRLSSANQPEQLDALQEEVRDRFGPIPESVQQFFEHEHLRLLANKIRVAAIERKKNILEFRLTEEVSLEPENLIKLAKQLPAQAISEGDTMLLKYSLLEKDTENILSKVVSLLQTINQYRNTS